MGHRLVAVAACLSVFVGEALRQEFPTTGLQLLFAKPHDLRSTRAHVGAPIDTSRTLVRTNVLGGYESYGQDDRSYRGIMQNLFERERDLRSRSSLSEERDFGNIDPQSPSGVVIAQHLRMLPSRLRHMFFWGNEHLSPAGWTALLEPLTRDVSGVVGLNFGGCELDELQAAAIGDKLSHLSPSIRELDFSWNTRLLSSGWSAILQPMTDTSKGFEKVSFAWCNLDQPSATAIGDILTNMGPNVKKLEFVGNRDLTKNGWRALLRPIAHGRFDGLQEVSFEGCELDDGRASALSRQLSRLDSTVKRLDFALNPRLSPDGWGTLLRPLTSEGSLSGAGLEVFDVSGCDLSDGQATEIASFLQRRSPTVQELLLGGNPSLQEEGWRALLQPLATPQSQIEKLNFGMCDLNDASAEAIYSQLTNMKHFVKQLNFEKATLSPEGWAALLQAISNPNSNLQDINFGGCLLVDEKVNEISKWLGHLPPKVTRLRFQGNPSLSAFGWRLILSPMTATNSGLEEVDFWGCSLDDNRAQAISQGMMQIVPTVRKLDFSGNGALSPTGWSALMTPLAKPYSRIEEVNFAWTGLTDACASAIGVQMERMGPVVKRLDFGGNSALSSEGWTALLAPLAHPHLEDISFRWCSLSDESARAISSNLANMSSTVKSLRFGHNDLLSSDSWAELLRPMASVFCNLVEVNFEGCHLDDVGARLISTELRNMGPTVQKVSFGGNPALAPHSWSNLLRPLTQSRCLLEEIDFTRCNLLDSQVEYITQVLAITSSTVKKLDYSDNTRLSTNGWAQLLYPLTIEGTNLEELNFGGCDLDDKSATTIGTTIRKLVPTVKRINMQGNHRLTSAGWTALLQPLTLPGSSLAEIDFSGCGLDDESAAKIGKAIADFSPVVKTVNIEWFLQLALATDSAPGSPHATFFLPEPLPQMTWPGGQLDGTAQAEWARVQQDSAAQRTSGRPDGVTPDQWAQRQRNGVSGGWASQDASTQKAWASSQPYGAAPAQRAPSQADSASGKWPGGRPDGASPTQWASRRDDSSAEFARGRRDGAAPADWASGRGVSPGPSEWAPGRRDDSSAEFARGRRDGAAPADWAAPGREKGPGSPDWTPGGWAPGGRVTPSVEVAPWRRDGAAPPNWAPGRGVGPAPPDGAPGRRDGFVPGGWAPGQRDGSVPPDWAHGRQDGSGPTLRTPGEPDDSSAEFGSGRRDSGPRKNWAPWARGPQQGGPPRDYAPDEWARERRYDNYPKGMQDDQSKWSGAGPDGPPK